MSLRHCLSIVSICRDNVQRVGPLSLLGYCHPLSRKANIATVPGNSSRTPRFFISYRRRAQDDARLALFLVERLKHAGCESLSIKAGRIGDEGPQHPVTIARAFAVGKFEVRFDEWMQCVAATECKVVPDEGWGRGLRPVVNVSWSDARRYVSWLAKKTGKAYRLLTEAEWEYVSRVRAPFVPTRTTARSNIFDTYAIEKIVSACGLLIAAGGHAALRPPYVGDASRHGSRIGAASCA